MTLIHWPWHSPKPCSSITCLWENSTDPTAWLNPLKKVWQRKCVEFTFDFQICMVKSNRFPADFPYPFGIKPSQKFMGLPSHFWWNRGCATSTLTNVHKSSSWYDLIDSPSQHPWNSPFSMPDIHVFHVHPWNFQKKFPGFSIPSQRDLGAMAQTCFSSWLFATPGSPIIKVWMSPRIFRPSCQAMSPMGCEWDMNFLMGYKYGYDFLEKMITLLFCIYIYII